MFPVVGVEHKSEGVGATGGGTNAEQMDSVRAAAVEARGMVAAAQLQASPLEPMRHPWYNSQSSASCGGCARDWVVVMPVCRSRTGEHIVRADLLIRVFGVATRQRSTK